MRRKRILLVDDEISFARLLKLNLEQTGDYEVRVENWAEDAVAAAREFRPDLVLLDIVMPRLIGGDVAARLRADDSLRAIPIVFLSAAVGRKCVEDHNGVVGCFPFIAKPASVEEVIDRVEQVLSAESRQHRPGDPSDPPSPGRQSRQRPEEFEAMAFNYA